LKVKALALLLGARAAERTVSGEIVYALTQQLAEASELGRRSQIAYVARERIARQNVTSEARI
jgi:hypothetical protein